MDYFNPAAFFILFRESVEASLIISILLSFITKQIQDPITAQKLKRHVWIGVTVGIIASILVGIIFTVVFYVLQRDFFSGEFEYLFESILFTLTWIFLTWLAFTMMSAKNLREKWALKIQTAIEKNNGSLGSIGYGFMFMVFTIVFREGLESVVFIAGVGSSSPVALILPSILGIAVGVIIGMLINRGVKNVSIDLFFKISAGFLFIIAAGLCSISAHEMEEYHFLMIIKNAPEGTDTSSYPDETPQLWDVSNCCSHKKNYFFQVVRAFTGWTATPTVLTTVFYFSYWLLVILIALALRLRKQMALKNGKADSEIEKIDQDKI